MTYAFWFRKGFALTVAIVMLACAAVFLSVGLTHPMPFPYADASAEWQCSKTAGILTVCSRTAHTKPEFHSSREVPMCLRRRA